MSNPLSRSDLEFDLSQTKLILPAGPLSNVTCFLGSYAKCRMVGCDEKVKMNIIVIIGNIHILCQYHTISQMLMVDDIGGGR